MLPSSASVSSPVARLDIHQIPVRTDNYIYLVRDRVTRACAVIDPADAEPVLDAARQKGWDITHILNTHHHGDHVGGNLTIKKATNCEIIGFGPDRDRIPGLDRAVAQGDSVALGESIAQVFEVPGHTRGHIAYWFADAQLPIPQSAEPGLSEPDQTAGALFCGDTLFSLGCGRLFEGTPAQMWQSLQKLRDLPDHTLVYCAHEYTRANLSFALSVDPDNAALSRRGSAIVQLRADNAPTVPALLGQEKAANPFLRADDPGLATAMGLAGQDPVTVFGAVRRAKDTF